MISMMGFAFFVLFLERPLHAASLWMLAAVAARLVRPEGDASRVPWTPLAHARQVALAKGFR